MQQNSVSTQQQLSCTRLQCRKVNNNKPEESLSRSPLASTASLPNPINNSTTTVDLFPDEYIGARRIYNLSNAANRTRPTTYKELGLSGYDSILGDLSAVDLRDGVDFRRKRLEMSFDFLDAAALVFYGQLLI